MLDTLTQDQCKRIYEAVKHDSPYNALRKKFYLSPCGQWLSYKKIEGYTLCKTEYILKRLKKC